MNKNKLLPPYSQATIFSFFSFITLLSLLLSSSVSAETYADSISTAAKNSLGKEMWKPGYGLSNGKLGCAAAVCNVLKKAGIKDINTAGVVKMRTQLLGLNKNSKEFVIRNGEGKEINDSLLLKTAHPGDVVLAFMEPPTKSNSGPRAHCGIMGAGTNVYTNNWMDGIWTEVEIHQMFDYFPYIRLIRLSSGK